MAGYTKNFNLKLPSDIEFYDIEDFNENFEKIDQMAVKKGEGIGELTGGALSDRPEPGIAGRYYFAQDTGEIFLDTGEEWVLAAASQKELAAHKAEKAQQAHGENLELIASVSLNSAAQINFVNIPQTYKHLKLVLIGRVNVAQKDIMVGINLNDVSTQSYNTQRLISAGTQITSAYSSETVAYIGKCPGTDASSDKQNGFFEIDILDYSGTKRKSILARYTSQLDDGVETGIYSTFTTIEEGINKINTTHWWQAGTIASLYGVRG